MNGDYYPVQPVRSLQVRDHLRVIAPSRSLGLIGHDRARKASQVLNDIGLETSLGRYVWERDEHDSSSVDARVYDLHEAFADTSVDGVLTAIGGSSSIELLEHIDFELLRQNPKVLSGYSDITVLENALLTQSGLQTLYGPHFSSFSMPHGYEYMVNSFVDSAMGDGKVKLKQPVNWQDENWYLQTDDPELHTDTGFMNIKPGSASGQVVGGYLPGFSSLFGTKYAPNLRNKVVLAEVTGATKPPEFRRQIHGLMLQPDADKIAALLVGRMPGATEITDEELRTTVLDATEGLSIPIVAGLPFGHTMPIASIPIGGKAEVLVSGDETSVVFDRNGYSVSGGGGR